jgi:hypothetical protein
VRAIGLWRSYITARALAGRYGGRPFVVRGRLGARKLRFCGLTQQPRLVASAGIHALRQRAIII